MSKFLTKVFWKTLWQDKRMLIIVITALLVIALGFYSWFQMKRSWNWNVGGYGSRAEAQICKMAEKGAIAKGPKWKEYCD